MMQLAASVARARFGTMKAILSIASQTVKPGRVADRTGCKPRANNRFFPVGQGGAPRRPSGRTIIAPGDASKGKEDIPARRRKATTYET